MIEYEITKIRYQMDGGRWKIGLFSNITCSIL